jgi:hypothetical protein
MFMRYLGGGVGHCSSVSIPLYDECDNDEDMDTNDRPLEDEDGSDTDMPYRSDGDIEEVDLNKYDDL